MKFGIDGKKTVESQEKIFGKPVVKNVGKFGAKFEGTSASNEAYARQGSDKFNDDGETDL